jgi:hypothetical protein
MSETVNPDSEAPTYVVSDYGSTIFAILALREQGAVIVDFREADETDRIRIADALNGAALAHGNSPFKLEDRVLFLTKDRGPSRAETRKFRSSPE